MAVDKDDKRVDELVDKHLAFLNDDDPRALANFKSDFIMALLDARTEERVRATGESWAIAESNVVANLRRPEEDRALEDSHGTK